MIAGTESCAVCSTPAEHKCSACKNIFYCSREHQKSHWKTHAKRCRPFKLSVDDVLGRHYVAIRNIAVGEVVLREDEPLVAGPPHDTAPLCLNCYAVLDAGNAVPCEKCGWPLCALCKEHGPECEFTMKYKDTKVSITDYVFPHPTYECVTTIRALCLRDSDPERYKKLLNLEAHGEMHERHGISTQRTVAQFVRRFFTIDVPEDEIVRIGGVIQVNGHEVPLTEPAHVAVYDVASLLEHSCRSNCTKSFTSKGGVVVRAALPIAKGDHITICYTDPLWGAANRRHHLSQTKYFQCTCDRCEDPTEYGTMFNALRCSDKECNGYMLPKTFITSDEERPDYHCNKCPATRTAEAVDKILERIGVDLSHMKKDDVASGKLFVDHYGKLIHDNHYYLTDVKLALAQLIGQQDGGLPAVNDDMLNEKILLCKQVGELLRTLVPAETRVRGLILFEMHAAIAEFGRRQGPGELRGALLESKRILTEAHTLLSYEPDVLPEGKIAIQARKNLQDMETILQVMHQNVGISPM